MKFLNNGFVYFLLFQYTEILLINWNSFIITSPEKYQTELNLQNYWYISQYSVSVYMKIQVSSKKKNIICTYNFVNESEIKFTRMLVLLTKGFYQALCLWNERGTRQYNCNCIWKIVLQKPFLKPLKKSRLHKS